MHFRCVNATDALEPFAASTMPLGFIGKTDPDEELQRLWSQVWDAGAQAGDSAAIKRHVGPIIELALACLRAPIYALRAQGSAAIAVVARTPRLSLPPALLALACTGLCEALPGRLWEGKVAVLSAVAALCKQLAPPDSDKTVAAAAADAAADAAVKAEAATAAAAAVAAAIEEGEEASDMEAVGVPAKKRTRESGSPIDVEARMKTLEPMQEGGGTVPELELSLKGMITVLLVQCNRKRPSFRLAAFVSRLPRRPMYRRPMACSSAMHCVCAL
eukprot:SAG11_NODE_78_length_17939_cov_10.236883_4_plen_274_part_00